MRIGDWLGRSLTDFPDCKIVNASWMLNTDGTVTVVIGLEDGREINRTLPLVKLMELVFDFED